MIKFEDKMKSAYSFAFLDYAGNRLELAESLIFARERANLEDYLGFKVLYDDARLQRSSIVEGLPLRIGEAVRNIRVHNSQLKIVNASTLRYAIVAENPDGVPANSRNSFLQDKANKKAALMLRETIELMNGDLLGSVVLYLGAKGNAKRYSINGIGKR